MFEQLGITPLRVDLPFRLNHVNCFMAENENGWTIIDTGLNNAYTAQLWKDQLQDKKVTELFITHYHPDHIGYAGTLQQQTNAAVSMSKIDADSVQNAWSQTFLDELHSHYKASGIPLAIAKEMQENTESFKPLLQPLPTVNHYFIEGEKVRIGHYEYEVIHTPGHAEGMVCFYNAEKNVLLSADHILPRITPNISYWYHGDPNPLKSYLESITSMKKLNADFVIPSHGKPFHGANNRIDEIVHHHDERLQATMEAIDTGTSVYDVFKRLFQWELTTHEIRFALGETLAHLEYLRLDGACSREMQNDKWIYLKN